MLALGRYKKSVYNLTRCFYFEGSPKYSLVTVLLEPIHKSDYGKSKYSALFERVTKNVSLVQF